MLQAIIQKELQKGNQPKIYCGAVFAFSDWFLFMDYDSSSSLQIYSDWLDPWNLIKALLKYPNSTQSFGDKYVPKGLFDEIGQ